MRITIVHNPEAGTKRPGRDELISVLESRGHSILYQSTEAGEITHALGVPADLVIVAGGDGTVGAVARSLFRRNTPMAILPQGTANNIASFLGVDWTLDGLAEGLASASSKALDVGVARGPWGVARFVEAAGIGLVAALLRGAAQDHAHDRLASGQTVQSTHDVSEGAARVRRALEQIRARPRRIESDGVDLSGEYLLVAALNVGRVGPRLDLAPDADPGDGALDLVLLKEDDRETLDNYLAELAQGKANGVRFASRRVKQLTLGWPSEGGHLDDELWPRNASGKGQSDTPVVVEVVGSVEVLHPAGAATDTAPASHESGG